MPARRHDQAGRFLARPWCNTNRSPPTPESGAPTEPLDWRTQELLLLSEVMRSVGRSLAPELVLREMLHLMSELLGLTRGRVVLADDHQHLAA